MTPDASFLARARVTWALAWPVIIAFSLDSIVGLVDALMVGRLGATPVAAVGIGVHVLSALSVGMFAVGTGTLAIVARHVGAGERFEAERTLEQAIIAAAALGVATLVPVWLFTPAIVSVFRVEPAVQMAAIPFVRRVILAVPPEAILFTIAASLRAAGDTRTPLAIFVVFGIVKLTVAWVLIFGFAGVPALGIIGAATGSVAAFTIAALLGVALLARGRLRLALVWRGLRIDWPRIGRILRIGYPSAIEHTIMQVGFLMYMLFAARYGTASVAAYFIGARILGLSFLPGLGFGAAAGTLVGQALGARRVDEARRSGWTSTILAMIFMTIGGVVLFVWAEPVARLFVDDPAVVTATVSFIRVLAAVQPLMAIDFTLGGVLKGAGDTRFPLIVALVAFYGCRLGAAWLVTFVLEWPLVWLWAALIGDYIVRAALKTWRFQSGAWATVRV